MLVIGGNAVGLELAQLFARLGVTVTIAEALDRLTNQQVSGPHHNHSRRSPGDRELRFPACTSDVRQIRKHKGSWMGVD